ncbi:MAG: hypothetical protein LIP03_02730 [Bacteroidales bacterium]|nr:hypothetical protein [Bacteroidales bacterium]
MVIAVDFDGTIVEHRYPEIGRERPFAIAALKRLQAEGHRLILWTAREGDLLDDALAWCRERGIEFFAANANSPEEEGEPTTRCRKVVADCYIDDRNLGGLPDWGAICDIITDGETFEQYLMARIETAPQPRRSWLQRLLG